MLIETLGTARDLGRLNEIAGVLIRHGFGDSVRRLGPADVLELAGHVLHREHAADLARLEPPVPRPRRAGADLRQARADPRRPRRPVRPAVVRSNHPHDDE